VPRTTSQGIIGGHVDHFWICGFNDDRAALRSHLLLFVAVQVASTAGLLTQGLHRICDILRLVDICSRATSSKRDSCPCFKNRGKLCEGLDARVQGCLSTSLASSSPLSLEWLSIHRSASTISVG